MKIHHELDPPRPLAGFSSIPPSARVFPSQTRIHAISDPPSTPTPISTSFDRRLPPNLPDATPACLYTPVSAVTSNADPSTPSPPILAEHGPCLSSGTVIVNDASFTVRTKLHSGPSGTSRYPPISFLSAPVPHERSSPLKPGRE